ncbi:MAG TPA: serine/threonine-protein kinase [Pseudonocardiaceae bacterium]
MTAPGDLVAGRYRLVERIGAGAMGVVWLANDERLGRTVALKKLVPSPLSVHVVGRDGIGHSTARASERMMREGRIAAKLHHPNAISVFDVTDHAGTPWLVMEYLPSRSLATVLAEQGPLPAREVAGIGRQLADALAAAHAAGIVHRDVKPGNVLLAEGPGSGAASGIVAKLTDFGISRAADDVTLTSTGVLSGTPAYLAPEVARGAEPSPASDVFALGATLYAAVEGQPPFGSGDNALALLHQVAGGNVVPPRHAGQLTALLMQLLRADPAERPTMAQAAVALGAITDGRLPPPGAFDSHAPPGGAVFLGPAGGTADSAGPHGGYTIVDLPQVANEVAGQAASEADRRPALLIAIGVALAVLAGLLVLVATTGPERPAAQGPAPTETSDEPTAPPTATTTAPPTATPSPPSAADLQRAVTEYYALLPDNPSGAWARLGPSLQARGFGAYQTFWSGVDSLQAVPANVEPATMTVRVLLVLRRDGHRPQAEVHDLRLIQSGDALLIDQDTKIAGTAAPTTTTKKRRG